MNSRPWAAGLTGSANRLAGPRQRVVQNGCGAGGQLGCGTVPGCSATSSWAPLAAHLTTGPHPRPCPPQCAGWRLGKNAAGHDCISHEWKVRNFRAGLDLFQRCGGAGGGGLGWARQRATAGAGIGQCSGNAGTSTQLGMLLHCVLCCCRMAAARMPPALLLAYITFALQDCGDCGGGGPPPRPPPHRLQHRGAWGGRRQ